MSASEYKHPGPARALRASFRTLSLRYYKTHPGRFLLCILGLSAGVAVAGSINLTNSRVIESFSESMDTLAGNANLRITDDRGIPPEQLNQLRFIWDHGQFTPFVRLDGAVRSTSQANAGNPEKAETRAVVLFGFDFLGARRIRGLAFGDRDANPDSPLPNPHGLPELVVAANSVIGAPGESVTVTINGQPREFLISRVLEGINGRYPPVNTAYLELATAMRLAPGGNLSGVDLMLNPEVVAEIRPRLERRFPGAEILTLAERKQITNDMLAAFQMNLQALGIVALLVSAYLVYNTINISVIQREGLIASLLSIGAAPRQVFAALVLEGVWLGILGGALGLVFGYGLSLIASREVDLTLETVFRLDVIRGDADGLFALFISFLLGVVFAALAAALPAYRGARVPVATLRRPGRSEFRPRVLGVSAVAATICLGLFAACFCLARAYQSPGPGYGSVAALVGILSALAPLAIWLCATLARWLHASGPARLAGAAAREHILKIAVAVAALGIALSMAGAVSVMVHSFRTTVISWLNTTVIADIYIRQDSGSNRLSGAIPDDLLAQLRADPRVAAVLTIRTAERVFQGQRIRLGANEFAVAARYRPLSFVEGNISDLERALKTEGGGVLVSEVFANRFRLRRGDKFEFAGREIPIHAVFRSYASERGFVLMDTSLFAELIAPRGPSGVALYLNEGIKPEKAMQELRESLSSYALDMSLSTEIRAQAIAIFNQTFRLTYILQLIAGGIAALSVITTLTGLALERRREFATLQALGAKPGLLDRAMAWESQIIAWSAMAIAFPGSVLLSVLLIHVINRYSFGWTIESAVPYTDLLIAAAGITILALVAALAPIRLIRQQNIAQILKQD